MIFRSPYPDVEVPTVSLADFALRHAERLASKSAMIDASTGRTLSYEQLADGVRRVSAGLWRHGVRKGDVLALCAPNGPDHAVAFYAVASLGGIVTPANPLLTAAEMGGQLRDAEAAYVMTTPDLLPRVSEAAERTAVRGTFVLGETDDAIHVNTLLGTDGWAPSVAIDPGMDIAMLPFSSGTTGMPKGVMLTHRNLVANVCQTGVSNRFAEHDIVLAVPPFFHVTGIYLLTSVLAHGATLVTLPRFDLRSFLRAIEQYQVTRATVVPPIVLALVNEPSVDSFDLSSLKRITCGAAPLDAELERRCEQRLGCAVGQGYGMTEASPVTHVTPIEAGRSKPGSVGPPIPNTECKVVDPGTGAELGPNQRGELWVRGPQVMKGYLNLPDATARAITPDGWLRTGDLVSIDEDGDLFVVDRLKELIKYKGYQVAPAELEAVLLVHPAVADAAVIPSPDDDTGEVPKAFVVLKCEATAEELMAFVASRVAPYQKVRRVEFVEQIPKSPSGKILRRILVERERAAVLMPA